jgi:hypothetical protein
MERERGPFFRPDRWGGGVRGRRIYPSRPLQPPPPWSILGGWGGTQVEGKQQILEMRLADASYHFYL